MNAASILAFLALWLIAGALVALVVGPAIAAAEREFEASQRGSDAGRGGVDGVSHRQPFTTSKDRNHG